MFNVFNSNVFVEMSEAIGSVKRKAFGKRAHPDIVDRAFRKWLTQSPCLKLPPRDEGLHYPDGMTIDASFRVLVGQGDES